MREIIHSLPEQIFEAINIFTNSFKYDADKDVFKKKFDRILICGMGGSGISGDIAAVLYPELEIIVSKDYQIPQYIDKKTLAILVSYSGNTEETLSNYRQLTKNNIPILVISSNGELLKKRAALKVQIPKGLPPRGALGYLFTPIPFILYKTGLIKKNPEQILIKAALFLRKQAKILEKQGKALAQITLDKLPIIYADSSAFAVVAKRWQCQLNENSKMLCHTNIIPEMNHNEIVGLGRPVRLNKDMIVFFLNDPGAFSRNKLRVRIIKEIVNNEIRGLKTIDIKPKGRNLLEQMFWTIMLGDFLSLYLALDYGIDPMPVKRIDYLKQKLSVIR
ncbi:MAG: bifunctional phosphoglucose/phosphomannose isomerase [bacterium]